MKSISGPQFFQSIQELLLLLKQTPEQFSSRYLTVQEELHSISKQEVNPSPESSYPDWLSFKSDYASALDGSHLCAHYFELSGPTLSKAAEVYNQLVTYIADKEITLALLNEFIDHLHQKDVLSRSRTVETPAWKMATTPNHTSYYLQMVVNLDFEQRVRAVSTPLSNVEIVKRHEGSQFSFSTISQKGLIQQSCSTLVLTLWVLQSKENPVEFEVKFGTGYVGTTFPFEESNLLTYFSRQSIDDKIRMACIEEMKRFVETLEKEEMVKALLPPGVVIS